ARSNSVHRHITDLSCLRNGDSNISTLGLFTCSRCPRAQAEYGNCGACGGWVALVTEAREVSSSWRRGLRVHDERSHASARRPESARDVQANRVSVEDEGARR